MSDQTGNVSLPDTLNMTEVRAEALEGFGKARLRTVVVYASGPQTLSGTADEVWCAGTFTVNLPPSPTDGDHYDFVQRTNGATLTIGRNGKLIDGAASDATLVGAATYQWKSLTWSATAGTWASK